MGQPNFHPVYKVKCCAGHVEYKLHIDAVTGTVLSSKADVDDVCSKERRIYQCFLAI